MNINKPYGTCGKNSYGKCYYQNNKFYNKLFQEVDDLGNLVVKKEEVKEIKTTPVKRRGRKPVIKG